MTPREAYIGLNMIEGLGPVRVRALVGTLGSPERVFKAAEEDLLRAEGVGPQLAAKIAAQRGEVDPGAEEERAARAGARILTPLDGEYPERLKTIHDPPLALYVRGSLAPRDRHAVAVVGSRRSTHYGNTVADRLSYQLAKTGFTVVSGLARGIDEAAHRGALKGGGRTIAVLGSGLDRMYPPESEALAAEIADSGAVISEFPMGKEPDRTTFPYRNRIVSGISLGVLVVEAGLKSGALHTADSALDQGRSVFAVPGRIDAQASKGTHQLLKAGARLVTDIDDIVEEFETLFPPGNKAGTASPASRPEITLTEDERKVVTPLIGAGMDVDTLARTAGLTATGVSSVLIGLEMKRVVRMLPGRRVELTVEINDPES
jgi:DNA processing protein